MSNAPGGFLPPLDPQQKPGGSSMTRVMLTASLMLIAWMSIQMFGPKKDAEPKTTTPDAAQTTTAPTTTTPPPSPDAAAPPPTGTPNSLPEETRVFAADVAKGADTGDVTGGYDATVSSWGAQLTRFELTDYFETKLKKKEDFQGAVRVNLAKARNQGAQIPALRSRGGDVELAADAPYEIVAADAHHVEFSRLTSSGVRVSRSYTFDEQSFKVVHTLTLKNESEARKTAQLDMVLTGTERVAERDEGGMFSPGGDRLGGHCDIGGKRHHFLSKKVQSDPEDMIWTGPVKSAAIDRHYFIAAVAFEGTPTDGCKSTFFQQTVPASTATATESGKGIEVEVALSAIPLAPGESKTFTQDAFFGPKQITILQSFGHGLDESIDVGMFAVISRPLLWLLVRIKGEVHNYGFAIICLTLLIFGLTFPLTHKSMVEMKKFSKVMKELKPELDKLKEKYGHDQRLMVEKQQAFFSSKGVNPFANLMGCLPMLISMPVWMALYRTLSTSVELFQQPFPLLGILDLTQPDAILFGWPLLPFIVCGLMFVSTLQQPPPEDQPQMKYMMYGMPVFFLFIMFSMASGLSLYMITNSILRMAQSWFIKRKHG
jgi:YidC/Oxa1 family membrane protein insertase